MTETDFGAALRRELPTGAGKVADVIGTVVRVTGLDAACGELCELRDRAGRLQQRAEVVGFAGQHALLMPLGSTAGLSRSTLVIGTGRPLRVRVGPKLLGRVIDVLGEPIDGRGPIETEGERDILCAPPAPMERPMIATPLPTGVRCVDGLMTLGEGQRMGIFAPAGTGKSTLMAMFARSARSAWPPASRPRGAASRLRSSPSCRACSSDRACRPPARSRRSTPSWPRTTAAPIRSRKRCAASSTAT